MCCYPRTKVTATAFKWFIKLLSTWRGVSCSAYDIQYQAWFGFHKQVWYRILKAPYSSKIDILLSKKGLMN